MKGRGCTIDPMPTAAVPDHADTARSERRVREESPRCGGINIVREGEID